MSETKKREKKPKSTPKKESFLTPEEKELKDEINAYLRDEIFKYDSGKALPKFLWVRIESYRQGKTFARGDMSKAHIYYSYEEILITFKYCKYDILKCLNSMEFKDEYHKINTIMTYIDRNINFVKDKLRQQDELRAKVKQENLEKYKNLDTQESLYSVKSKENTDMEEYW